MKKTDVYVVVDTPKKAKKLKKVLDMFGEDHTGEAIGDNYYNGVKLFDDTWCAIKTEIEVDNETEVSIKELRNILAKEHLKEGDVVVMRSKAFGKIILEVKGMDGEKIDIKKELFVETGSRYNDGHETIGKIDFIRYATEEEKALLEPKEELEVGKWYRFKNNNLVFTTSELSGGHVSGYGFAHGGTEWIDEYPYFLVESFKEATPQEVEQALIKEAKRTGFVNGAIGNNSNIHDTTLKNCELFFNNQYEYDDKDNLLRVILDSDTTWTVFKDGQWATVIEQDNFTDYDIAIVEKLHNTLLDNHGYSLQSELLIDARMLANKIKSNIK